MGELQKAIETIKAGDKQAGGELLREFLQTYPENETAWLWLSVTFENYDQKKRCLQKVLQIQPDNIIAKRALEKLSSIEINELPGVEDIISVGKPSKTNIEIKSPSTALPVKQIQNKPKFNQWYISLNPWIRIWLVVGLISVFSALGKLTVDVFSSRPLSNALIRFMFGIGALTFAGFLHLINVDQLSSNIKRHVLAVSILMFPTGFCLQFFFVAPKAMLYFFEGDSLGNLMALIVFFTVVLIYVTSLAYFSIHGKPNKEIGEIRLERILLSGTILLVCLSFVLFSCGPMVLVISNAPGLVGG